MEKFLTNLGHLEALIFLIGILAAIWTAVRGVTPALWRLGNGLAKRKIAIFAKGDNLAGLKHLLSDSGLFRPKNIIDVTNAGDIGRAEPASVYLVFWHDWIGSIDQILEQKPDKCALIVYSPYDREKISAENMNKLDGKRHTAVTQFRGRLLGDLVSAMITTSYEEK